jgi:hypothetical protein
MFDPQPGHVRPNQIPQRLSPGSDISGSQVGLQRGGSDMSAPNLDISRFLAPQRLFLVVQEKLDCLVSETGLSDFHGFNPSPPPPDRTYPFTVFSHFSLSLSLKNNCEGDPKTSIGDPLVPPWNLGVLRSNQLPKKRCLHSPNRIFTISRYSLLILDLFAPWMDLKFLWCIVFIHIIDQSPAISLRFLG